MRRAGGCDDAAAVGEQRDGECDARVEVLADEEVAVVECGGGEVDDEFVRLGGWGREGDVREGVVDFAWGAGGLVDGDCEGHAGGERAVRERVVMLRGECSD